MKNPCEADLRQSRQTQGLSQRDVGAKLHLPHSWVGKIETGERRLDVVEFHWVCEALGQDAATVYSELVAAFKTDGTR